MNKATRISLIATLFIIFGVAILFSVYYGVILTSKDNAFATAVAQGNDLMDIADYQGAIDKYVAALDYEPENIELKQAIAHAYVCLAGTLGNSNEAIEAYNNALLYNQQNTNAYWGMSNIYEAWDDEDNVLITLQSGYTNTSDSNMKIKSDNIIIERERIAAEEEARRKEEEERLAKEEAHNEILSKLMSAFEGEEVEVNSDDEEESDSDEETDNSNKDKNKEKNKNKDKNKDNEDGIDYDLIKELLRSDEFVNMAEEIVSLNDSIYYGDTDDAGLRNGKGIAVYCDGYYYYGDFVDDLRSGDGIYIRATYGEGSAMGSFIYDGEWENDLPNGKGTATSNYYPEEISSSELKLKIIKGTFKDGLEDGDMTLNGTTKGGSSVNYEYTVTDGVPDKLSDEDSGVKGQYIISKSKDGNTNLTSDGSKRGVEGFVE